MILFNKTKLPDELIEALIKKAAKAAHCPVGGFAVRIKNNYRGGGLFKHNEYINLNHPGYGGKKYSEKLWKKTGSGWRKPRWKRVDGVVNAYAPIKKYFRKGYTCLNPVQDVEYLYKTLVHEFTHAVEWRKFKRGKTPKLVWSGRDDRGNWKGGRRGKWEDRPEEMRAVRATEEAIKKEDDAYEEIMALAIALENHSKGIK